MRLGASGGCRGVTPGLRPSLGLQPGNWAGKSRGLGNGRRAVRVTGDRASSLRVPVCGTGVLWSHGVPSGRWEGAGRRGGSVRELAGGRARTPAFRCPQAPHTHPPGPRVQVFGLTPFHPLGDNRSSHSSADRHPRPLLWAGGVTTGSLVPPSGSLGSPPAGPRTEPAPELLRYEGSTPLALHGGARRPRRGPGSGASEQRPNTSGLHSVPLASVHPACAGPPPPTLTMSVL